MGSGDLAASMRHARDIEDLGTRLEEQNLAALGRLARGRTLIKRGRVADGLALLDESMLVALAEPLAPVWAGAIYCHVMDACHEVSDLKRAAEWTETAARRLATLPAVSLYPGICRVHRAQVLQTRGDWADAERDAAQACEAMLNVHLVTAAEAQYELGEIRRLKGDFAGAEAALREAHQLGRDPQPGLALLRLAQGRLEAASSLVRTALASQDHDQLARTRLDAAQVEIALAAGETDTADSAASALEDTARTYQTSGLRSTALQARGAVALALGEPGEALTTLQTSCRIWLELNAPYEVARVRALMAVAYRELGSTDSAALEADTARTTFERLGAEPDARRMRSFIGAPDPTGLTQREIEVLRLVAAGLTNQHIATELRISERTVHRHVSNMFAKLDVSSRAAATAAAYEHGLVPRRHG